ncbi:hypothetical protein NP493_901g00083 [Ridgeia piscesae]|uniref:Uncharacterized protein n=1 Tax=Ridgeia piscesae TaxID=27915 RepID=A0AAD9KKA8_RIDPI|nr:hypothetical protein NP493_901g00083 [Ridgeia piscesae]
MASIPEADVFIPEACGVCSPGDKRSYNEWIDKTLIPQLKHQNISYVHPHWDFPANGDPKENIYTAVTNCTFTICCLCPAIATKFYQTLLEARIHKIIFLDIGEPPERWQHWKDWATQIVDCSNPYQVQVGVRRISKSLVNTTRPIAPTPGEALFNTRAGG